MNPGSAGFSLLRFEQAEACAPRTVFLAILLVSLLGCPRPPPAPAPLPDVAALAATYGATEVVTATLSMRVAPKDGDALVFTLRLARSADGRIRLAADKLDVSFLGVLLLPDGSFIARLVRDGVWCRGRVGDGKPLPMLLSCLVLLADEAGRGPIPAGLAWTATPDGALTATDAQRTTTTLTLDPATGLVRTKRVTGTDLAYTLEYGQERPFGPLLRAGKLHLAFPEDTTDYQVRVRDLGAPPSIAEGRLALPIPAEAKEIPLAEFAELLR